MLPGRLTSSPSARNTSRGSAAMDVSHVRPSHRFDTQMSIGQRPASWRSDSNDECFRSIGLP